MPDHDCVVNIVITTTVNRKKFLLPCLESISKNTIVPHRIICVCDGMESVNDNPLMDIFLLRDFKSPFIWLKQYNQGIACALNAGWALAEMYNQFHNETPYFCYIQDDTIVTQKGWLDLLIKCYTLVDKCANLEEGYKLIPIFKDNIGFFSGHDAPEHKTITEGHFHISAKGRDNYKIKESMRATNMIAETSFWRNLMPLGRHNPDGNIRGFPDAPKGGQERGKGSNIDVYLTGCNSAGYQEADAHPNNPFKLDFKCLVIPGLVKHVGYKAEDSTWSNENKEY